MSSKVKPPSAAGLYQGGVDWSLSCVAMKKIWKGIFEYVLWFYKAITLYDTGTDSSSCLVMSLVSLLTLLYLEDFYNSSGDDGMNVNDLTSFLSWLIISLSSVDKLLFFYCKEKKNIVCF